MSGPYEYFIPGISKDTVAMVDKLENLYKL